VRAPFHEKKAVTYDIVIEPKMSFGTGHHETTHMMLEEMLSMEMKGKSVLDMGCGTAILAILAGMQGASSVVGIDIDHWSYLNALENAERNDQGHITIIEGDVSAIPDTTFDIILANINRNCLLADIPEYVRHLADGGTLLLSGFYETDEPLLTRACEEKGLQRIGKRQRNSWVAVSYKKGYSQESVGR
jgi:ribosomal protein L11 methyltransferase